MTQKIQLDNFFAKLELQKRVGKQLLFVETDNQLESSVSFSQYIFSNMRLITLIGERHDKAFGCNSNGIPISEYCNNSVTRNPKCIVMLEYNSVDDPLRIGSEAIRTTYNTLNKAGKTNQIIPFDTRSFFLSSRGQNDLYGDGYNAYNTTEKIGNAFIEPFYQKQRENPKLFNLEGNYDKSAKKYLLHTYYPDLQKTFEYIAISLNKGNPKDINQMLKDAWKKVADYFILRTILKNDDVDEYIIVVGDSHRINLQAVFTFPFFTQLNNQHGSSGNCVRLYQTYKF